MEYKYRIRHEARAAGRSCPADYWYRAQSLARPADLRVECLWVAGGLYGNRFALAALLDAFAAERGTKALVFNGDFHWFDADPDDFAAIDGAVLAHHALRGNVETELARQSADADCGCAYPEWVDDDTVARSNRIMQRLRDTAKRVPPALSRLGALPMHLRVDVADARVAIVHGDAESLAGWAFSQEALASRAGMRAAEQRFVEADVDIFASSHTCLPVLQRFASGSVLVNNGAAGMPNFAGELPGIATRVALSPAKDSFYGIRSGEVFVDAVPLRYDAAAWRRRFLQLWPAGSDAHTSYFGRIVAGPRYSRRQSLRV